MKYQKGIAVALITAVLVVPGVAATHDNDPVPDNAEAILCGSSDVTMALGLLMGLGGSCTTGDYSHFALQPGAATCDLAFQCHQDLVVLPRTQLFAGQDVDALPLPPEEVPGQTVTTPPLDLPVTLVRDAQDPNLICVVVLPGQEVERVCVDLGPVIGPTIGQALPLEQVPGQSESTDPVPEGTFGATPAERVPAMSVDFALGVDWADDRLNEQVRTNNAGSYWMPVNVLDPDAVEWWTLNGDATALSLDVTVYLDDVAFTGPAPLDVVSFPLTVEVPYAGQAVAAMLRTTGA